MPLSHIEHFLLQTADMEKTRAWYVDVLGMRVGPSPDFKFPVFWLYLGDKDVVHVTEGGAKGVGEAGTAGAPGAVMNAINDALAPLNARVTAMPFTPERILKALRKI